MWRSKVLLVGAVVVLGTALFPGATLAQTPEPGDGEPFCAGYQNRYNAMTRLNDKIVARYQSVRATTQGDGGTGATGKGPKTRGNSANHRPENPGATQGQSPKAAALVRQQGRLAARSEALAKRVERECNATIAPIGATLGTVTAPS